MDELLYYDLKNVSGLTPGLASQVCREIGRRIVVGLFPEGQFIDDENKLCEIYNINPYYVSDNINHKSVVNNMLQRWDMLERFVIECSEKGEYDNDQFCPDLTLINVLVAGATLNVIVSALTV